MNKLRPNERQDTQRAVRGECGSVRWVGTCWCLSLDVTYGFGIWQVQRTQSVHNTREARATVTDLFSLFFKTVVDIAKGVVARTADAYLHPRPSQSMTITEGRHRRHRHHRAQA